MGASSLSPARWRKSSPSNGGSEQSDCIEVADLSSRMAMRDSKDPAGPVLALPGAQWRDFLGGVQTDEFATR